MVRKRETGNWEQSATVRYATADRNAAREREARRRNSRGAQVFLSEALGFQKFCKCEAEPERSRETPYWALERGAKANNEAVANL